MFEQVVGKAFIVAVIVLDGDTMLSRIFLERVFGFHRLFGSVVNLEVHVLQALVVVHKNCAAPVALLGERFFQLGKEPYLG